MHDGISAKINIQRCPQMIAQREVLVEASADRNTCCDSSHRVIRCMQKSNDMPQPGSTPDENKIGALACFSCASIKVVCGFWFSCPSVGLETERAKKQHPHGYQMVFRKNSLPALRAPFNLAGQPSKRKHLRFHMVMLCQDTGKSFSLTWTLIDACHILASRLIDIWNFESTFSFSNSGWKLEPPRCTQNKPPQQKCAHMRQLRLSQEAHKQVEFN